MRMENTLFADIFKVIQLDPDGKKFDKGIIVVDYCCGSLMLHLLI